MIVIILFFLYFNVARGYEDIFDDKYYAFPKDDSLVSYGYDVSHVCSIINLKGDTYAGLIDAYSIFKAPYTKLQNIKIDDQIQNCFNYKAFSYIITNNNNITTIMRGLLSRNFRLRQYDKVIYDHLVSKLYILGGSKLYEVNMTMLENFWLYKNYPQQLAEEMKNISLDHLFLFKNNLFGDKILDIMVLNNTVYFIRPEPSGALRINKQNIGEIQEEFVSNTLKPSFDIIPFVQISKYFVSNPKLSYSLGSISPTIVISLPSSSIKANQDLPMSMTILLYFLDALFVIGSIWALKYLFKISKNKYDNIKNGREVREVDANGREVREVDKANDEDIFLASLPYRKIIVSEQNN